MIKLRLAHHLCPGDSLVLSAAIRSLHLTYPGEYLTDVDCTAPELFANNPDITRLDRWDRFGHVSYAAGLESGCHMMAAMCDGLAKIINRPVPLAVERPILCLNDEERRWEGVLKLISPSPVPFVVLNVGSKADCRTKRIGNVIGQEVVDALRGRIRVVQIGTLSESHTPLEGVVNLIGKTTVRELARLVSFASAGIGPVTFLGHLCAALSVPYVCVLGGREPESWCRYPEQITLSTLGELDCCRSSACWNTHFQPSLPPTSRLCALPVVQSDGQTVAGCVSRLGSEAILGASLRAISDHIL